MLLHTHSDEWMKVVNKLLLHDATGGVAVVTVPGLVKQDVRVAVLRRMDGSECGTHLLVVEEVPQVRVLD